MASNVLPPQLRATYEIAFFASVVATFSFIHLSRGKRPSFAQRGRCRRNAALGSCRIHCPRGGFCSDVSEPTSTACLDTSFNGTGIVPTPIGSGHDFGNSAAIRGLTPKRRERESSLSLRALAP